MTDITIAAVTMRLHKNIHAEHYKYFYIIDTRKSTTDCIKFVNELRMFMNEELGIRTWIEFTKSRLTHLYLSNRPTDYEQKLVKEFYDNYTWTTYV